LGQKQIYAISGHPEPFFRNLLEMVSVAQVPGREAFAELLNAPLSSVFPEGKRGRKQGDYCGDKATLGRGSKSSGEMMLAPW
jgi:hypothetical protein